MAWMWPSSRCGITVLILLSICLDQPSARSSQCGTDGPFRQPGGRGDFVVVESFCFEQQNVTIPFVHLIQCRANRAKLLLLLILVFRPGRCRGAFGFEELEPSPLANGATSIIPDQVERNREQPGPMIVRRCSKRPGEDFLCQVLGSIPIARAAI